MYGHTHTDKIIHIRYTNICMMTYCHYKTFGTLEMAKICMSLFSFLFFNFVVRIGFGLSFYNFTVHNVKNICLYIWNINNKFSVFYGEENDKLYHFNRTDVQHVHYKIGILKILQINLKAYVYIYACVCSTSTFIYK